jgi:hypothetical protein
MKAAGPPAEAAPATPPPSASEGDRVLLPVLCGPSSSRGQAMLEFPTVRYPLVPGKVDVLFALVGLTPRGTLGMDWVMPELYEQMGQPPLEDLLDHAAANLAESLSYEYGDSTVGGRGAFFRREVGFAGSALAIPGLYDTMSDALGAKRMLVGIPDHDNMFVVDADSEAAFLAREVGLGDPCQPDGFLGPTVFLLEDDRIEVVADREL